MARARPFDETLVFARIKFSDSGIRAADGAKQAAIQYLMPQLRALSHCSTTVILRGGEQSFDHFVKPASIAAMSVRIKKGPPGRLPAGFCVRRARRGCAYFCFIAFESADDENQ